MNAASSEVSESKRRRKRSVSSPQRHATAANTSNLRKSLPQHLPPPKKTRAPQLSNDTLIVVVVRGCRHLLCPAIVQRNTGQSCRSVGVLPFRILDQ